MTLKIATYTHGYYVCELSQDYDTKTHFLVDWLNVCFFFCFFYQIVSCMFYFNHNKIMKNYPSNGPACKYLRIVFFIRGYRKMCTSHSDVRTLLIAKQNSHLSVILSGKLLNTSKVIGIITFLM